MATFTALHLQLEHLCKHMVLKQFNVEINDLNDINYLIYESPGHTGCIWNNDRGDRWSQPYTNTSFISHLIIEHFNCVNFLKKNVYPSSSRRAGDSCERWRRSTRGEVGDALVNQFHNYSDSNINRFYAVNDRRRCQSLVSGLSQYHNCPFVHLHPHSQGHFRSLGLNACLWTVGGSPKKVFGIQTHATNTHPMW